MRQLLKLGYHFTTLMATWGGRRFKSNGFSYFLRESLNRRREVLASLYQQRLKELPNYARQEQIDPALASYLAQFQELDGVMKGELPRKRIAFAGVRKLLGKETCTHPNISTMVYYYFDGAGGQGFSDCPDCNTKVFQGSYYEVHRNGPRVIPADPSDPLPRDNREAL